MIAIDQLVTEAVGILCCALGGAAIVQELNDLAGKDWPAMTLLAVVVLGIGGWMVRVQDKTGERVANAIEGNTQAQNDVAKALALLTQRETDAQHATEAKRTEIVAKLDKLAEHVHSLKAS
jgi:hypothetical protein